MDGFTLSDLRENIESFIERVEAGESIEITRAGRTLARVTPAAVETKRPPIDADALRALTASMPMQSQSTADFIREMRDSARY